MQRPRVQSTYGWAAFDRQHRPQKEKIDASSSDPFPPISGNTHAGPSSSLMRTSPSMMKPFSSVLRPCNLLENPVKLLKDANPWADHGLIEDVLEGVNNDLNMASQILKSMISNDSEDGKTPVAEEKSHSNVHKNKGFMEEAMPNENYSVLNGGGGSSTSSENNSSLNAMDNGSIFSVPIEPELEEEDDVYLDHRKDALKMMRAASNHSRAASNAFMRGDHVLARQLSQQAREEWAEAEKLNAKAAKEILMLKNANNDMSKLDLHGLHAVEAVRALEERLTKIESIDRLKMGPACKDATTTTRPRQNVLHVITGTGTHSKGQASLPAAVKSFLIEKRYRFEEARPGVIDVRPKFRYKIQTRPDGEELSRSL